MAPSRAGPEPCASATEPSIAGSTFPPQPKSPSIPHTETAARFIPRASCPQAKEASGAFRGPAGRDVGYTGVWDGASRIVIGVAVRTPTVTGPRSVWGLVGIVKLVTGVLRYRRVDRLFGIRTCPTHRQG